MVEQESKKLILRKIDETRNYLLGEIKTNIENLLILSSKINGCVSISEFDLLVAIPIGVMRNKNLGN